MNYKLLLFMSSWCFAGFLQAQQQQMVTGYFELDGIATSNHQVPFWMRTNQYGSMPLEGVSSSWIAGVYKNYHNNIPAQRKKLDWAAGASGRLNVGKNIQGVLTEAFVKARYGIFQLQAGRTRDMTGLVDSTLSMGAFAVSGNALGIPKVELSLPDYWSIPYTKGLIALKGNFAVGLAGKTTVNGYGNNVNEVNTYYHQKSLYGRLGKPGWKLKLYGGVNHEVFFGNEREISGPGFDLHSWNYFWHVMAGVSYGNQYVPRSKVGNHSGSVDQALSYDFRSVYLYAYHQFFYEVGGLFYLNNITDGLWGLSIQNRKEQNKNQPFRWNKVVFEFLGSKNQGGGLDAKVTPSGDEDYYNNFIYFDGWSYKQQNLGNNLFTNKNYARKELPQRAFQYIVNNRISGYHLAADITCYQWEGVVKLTYSKNFGTYATSPEGITTGSIRQIYPPPYFPRVNQFSAYLGASRPLKQHFIIGFGIAVDNGDLLYNSVGGMLRIIKTW